MPKAARARVASPPAGTALARAIRDCLPDRVRLGRGSILHVTLSVTNVNASVTSRSRHSPRHHRAKPFVERRSLNAYAGGPCGGAAPWIAGSSPAMTNYRTSWPGLARPTAAAGASFWPRSGERKFLPQSWPGVSRPSAAICCTAMAGLACSLKALPCLCGREGRQPKDGNLKTAT